MLAYLFSAGAIALAAARGLIIQGARWLVPAFARAAGPASAQGARVLAVREGLKNVLINVFPKTFKGWLTFAGVAVGTSAGVSAAGMAITDAWKNFVHGTPSRGFFMRTDMDRELGRNSYALGILKDLIWLPLALGGTWGMARIMWIITRDVVVSGAKIYGVSEVAYWLTNKAGIINDTAQMTGGNEGVPAADRWRELCEKRAAGTLSAEEKAEYEAVVDSIAARNSEIRKVTNEDLKTLVASGGKLELSDASHGVRLGTMFIPPMTSAETFGLVPGPDGFAIAVPIPSANTPSPNTPALPAPSAQPQAAPAQQAPAPGQPALWPNRVVEPYFSDRSKTPLFDATKPCREVEEDVLRDIFDLTDHCACEQQHDDAIMRSHDPVAARRAKMDFFLGSIGKAVSSIGKSALQKGSPLNTALSNMPGTAGVVFKGVTDVNEGYKTGGMTGALGAGLGALAQNAAGAASLASGGLAGGALGAATGLMSAQGIPTTTVPPVGSAAVPVPTGLMGGQPMYEIRGRVVVAPPGLTLVPLGGACVPVPTSSDAASPLGDYETFGPVGRRSFHADSPGIARLGALGPNGEVITVGSIMDFDLVSDRLHELCKNGALRRMVHRVRSTETFEEFMTELRRLVEGVPEDVIDEVGGEVGATLYFMADRAKQRRAHDFFFKKMKKKFKKLKRIGLAVGTGGLSEVARRLKKRKQRGGGEEEAGPEEEQPLGEQYPQDEVAEPAQPPNSPYNPPYSQHPQPQPNQGGTPQGYDPNFEARVLEALRAEEAEGGVDGGEEGGGDGFGQDSDAPVGSRSHVSD